MAINPSVLLLWILLGSFTASGQLCQMKKTLSAKEKKELLDLSKELFQYEPPFYFHISTALIKASLDEIMPPTQYTDEYRNELEKTILNDSLNSHAMFKMGDYYANTGDLVLAKGFFQKSLDLLDKNDFKADSSKYYSIRGFLKSHLNQEDALLDFEKALSINPKDSVAISFYPFMLMATGDATTAKNVFVKALSLSNESPVIPYTGLLLTELMESIQQITKVSNEDQKRKAEYRKMDYQELIDDHFTDKYGNRYRRLNEVKNARILGDIMGLSSKIIIFEKAVNKAPVLAYTKADLKQLAQLKRRVQKAWKHDRLNKYAVYSSLGFINYMQNNSSGAIDCFTKAIDIFPLSKLSDDFNPNESFESLLAIYYYNNDTASWRNTVERRIAAVPLKDQQATDYRNLAFYHFLNGSPVKAKYCAKKAEAINSLDIQTLQLLAHLYFLEGFDFMTSYYADKMNTAPCSPSQACHLFLQFAIYKLYQGDATGAYHNIQSARQLYKENAIGSPNCPLCDELEAGYLHVISY